MVHAVIKRLPHVQYTHSAPLNFTTAALGNHFYIWLGHGRQTLIKYSTTSWWQMVTKYRSMFFAYQQWIFCSMYAILISTLLIPVLITAFLFEKKRVFTKVFKILEHSRNYWACFYYTGVLLQILDWGLSRPVVKSVYQIFFYFPTKTYSVGTQNNVSMRWFFWAPKTYV